MFSIVMPYYKNEKVVRRSINSVLEQYEQDFELIIIDDGSNDSIEDIVAEYNDERIKIIHQDNHGVAHARNVGIRESKGEWICFLDSDDEWLRNHLSKIVELQKKYPNIFMFITSHRRLGAKTVDSSSLIPDSWDEDCIVEDLLNLIFKKGEVIHTNSICIHSDMFKKNGMFVEEVSIGEDTDLWYRFSMRTTPVITKTITTVYHRDASFLTAHNKYSINWPFAKRIDMVNDLSIPVERRESMKLILQRYELTTCKHLIANGEFKKAKAIFLKNKNVLSNGVKRQKRQIELLLLLPPKVAKLICNRIYIEKQKKY